MNLALSLVSGLNTLMPTPWWCLLYLLGMIAGIVGTTGLSLDSGQELYALLFIWGTCGIGVPLITRTFVGRILLGSDIMDDMDDWHPAIKYPLAATILMLTDYGCVLFGLGDSHCAQQLCGISIR